MIDVIWHDQCRGNWDHGLLCETFDKYPDIFVQHNSKQLIFPDRCIIIIAGKPDIAPLRRYLEAIDDGTVILTSDEDSYFGWKAAIPGHLDIWTSYYAPNKSEIKERILLGVPNRFKDYKINTHLPKKYLWSFVGQNQNPFRNKCVEVLSKLSDGYLKIISGFGGYTEDGMDYQAYLDIICQSKFVICPAGSMCVDSFRVYEAIECGAIPITDMRSPRDSDKFNYWNEVYPNNNLIQISDWNSLSGILNTWGGEHNLWWYTYKNELENKLCDLCN